MKDKELTEAQKPMKLHLTGEVRGMRYITCARRGFIWTVYTVNR